MRPASPHSPLRRLPQGLPGGAWCLAAPLLGWLAGTALQLQQRELDALWLYRAATGAGLLCWLAGWFLRRRGGGWMASALLAGAVAVAWGICGWRAYAFQAQALDGALEGRDVQVVAMVAAMPQRAAQGLRLRLAVEEALLDGESVQLPPLVDVGWYATSGFGDDAQMLSLPEVRAGQRWRMTLRLKAPHGNVNPWAFDYELWLWSQGVQATGYVRTGAKAQPPQLLQTTWRYPLERARQNVRDRILQRLVPQGSAAQMDRARHAGVLAALVTGDQRAIESRDWQLFRNTGIAHLVSISGLHITMFSWLAMVVMGLLWRRSARLCLWLPAPVAAAWGGLLLATLYALFSGWGVPAQRTILMLIVVVTLRLGGRRWPWGMVWLLACALVVAWDPWAMLQAGFWLSFVAVAILFASDGGVLQTPAAPSAVAGRWVWRHGLRLLREQAVVTLALTPLVLLLFHRISLVGFVANLLAIPWVTLVLLPLSMLGVAFAPLLELAAHGVRWMDAVLRALDALPLASVALPVAPVSLGMAAVAGGVWMILRLPWQMRLLGLPLLLPALLWQPPRPPPGEFEVIVPDVGQGGAVLVRTAGYSLVYDAGPRFSPVSDAGQRIMVPLLEALGDRPDALVLSHGDGDHTGGAAALLAFAPQVRVMASQWPQALDVREFEHCRSGQLWLHDGVSFEVLNPQAADYDGGVDANALSCVLRVSNGRNAVLLTGDIGRAQERRLLAEGVNVQADVLLLPHHGSRHSSSAEFLQATQARFAVAQAGYRNPFGHPAVQTQQRLRQAHITLLNTADCGAVLWRSAQPQQARRWRDTDRRYWHHQRTCVAEAQPER